MPDHPQRFWLVAFFVAWTVDFLFWEKTPGISFPIFTVLALAGGYILAWWEGKRPARLSLALSGLILVMAAVTALRSEPFTRLINAFLALVCLGLLARTFRTGGWIHIRLLDYLIIGLDLVIAGLSRAVSLPLAPADQPGNPRKRLFGQILPVLRGLLLALPVVILLAALLSSADLVFADRLDSLLANFQLDQLPEYFLRLFFILILAYLFAGLYLQAVLPVKSLAALWGDEQVFVARSLLAEDMEKDPSKVPDPAAAADKDPGGEDDLTRTTGVSAGAAPTAVREAGGRFLGAIESFIILGSVNLLFIFFVAIQFRYLFGGQNNITAAGYTFSEYARRGFFELVWVAVISLLLYLVLDSITHRRSTAHQRAFTGLSLLLVGLVLVILVSAFQRLLLYEEAYGFTRLRSYTHVFIPWLGFLLIATMALQLVRRERLFGTLLLLTAIGFALTFGVLNIDGMIARQNVARAQAGLSLDGAYLLGLSDGALPDLVRAFEQPEQPASVRDTLGAVLACRVYRLSTGEAQPWQSYHPGQAVARQALVAVNLAGYPVRGADSRAYVDLDGEQFDCYPPAGID